MNRRNSTAKGTSKKYQIELTSWSIFLWISCLSLLLAWVFVLGILVGRGFIPESATMISDIKSQLNKLQDMVSHNRRPILESVKKEDVDSKLAFYNELLSKKETEKGKGIPEAKAGPPKKETPPKKNPTAEERLAEIRAEVSAKEASPQGKGEGPPQRDPQQVSSAKGGYTLQIASLADKSRADETMRKLTKRGYDAYFYEVQVHGKPWYRVRCGHFATREEAEEFAVKVYKEAKLKGLVTKIE